MRGLGGKGAHEALFALGVLGTDRADDDRRAVGKVVMPLEMARIGGDRQMPVALRLAGGARTAMRASTASTPSGPANSGLMSSSAISGNSQTRSETRISTFDTASRSTAGRSRNASSSSATRVRSIRRLARMSLSGGRATALSFKTSTMVPPAPNTRVGPKTGSRLAPTSSSRAASTWAMVRP